MYSSTNYPRKLYVHNLDKFFYPKNIIHYKNILKKYKNSDVYKFNENNNSFKIIQVGFVGTTISFFFLII